MENAVIKFEHKKYLGILILIMRGLEFTSDIINTIIFSQNITVLSLLSTVAVIPVAVSFIIKDYNKQKIIFSLGMFFVALIQILYKITNARFSIMLLFIGLAYAGLGIISLTNYKYAKVGVVITLCLILEYAIFSTIGVVLINYQIRSGVYGITYCSSLLSIIELLFILLHFLTYTPKKNFDKPKNIKLNTNVIDFKTLLEFIENQYKLGTITEEEYLQKRAEILSKL